MPKKPAPPYCYQYPHPAVAVDVAIFSLQEARLQLLLMKRAKDPFSKKWALPGGFVDLNEDLDHCAWRKLEEKTSVVTPFLKQFAVFSAPERDRRSPIERVISVAYFALLPLDKVAPRAAVDTLEVRWFDVDKIPENLAFDHSKIVEIAIRELRNELTYRIDMLFGLLPNANNFTLPKLQKIYESIMNVKVTKSTFRKRVEDSVEPLGDKKEHGVSHRPARFYRRKV